jgi:hypothetical protein
MPKNIERRFYRGTAGWIIIGIIAAVAVILGVIMAFSSILNPGGPAIETNRTLQMSRRQLVLNTIQRQVAASHSKILKKLLLTLLSPVLSRSRIQKSALAERQAPLKHLQQGNWMRIIVQIVRMVVLRTP